MSETVEAWLHAFRSEHGEPYVFALVSDDAALYVRPAANTLAHLRRCEDVEAARWNRRAWMPLAAGAAFDHFSASLRVGAWEPGFQQFRVQLYTDMLLAMTDAARRGVFGNCARRGAMTLFASIDGAGDARAFERRAAKLLNLNGEAEALLAGI
ncbi:MAG TPA: DUF4303 domain-containing protein [Kofleriaceae bacterium]